MGGTFLQGNDPAALLFAIVVVAAAAIVAGRAVYHNRRKFPRWLRSVMVKKRLDVIVRDLDRMAESAGGISESEPAAWRLCPRAGGMRQLCISRRRRPGPTARTSLRC
jgi:hypothetical protein